MAEFSSDRYHPCETCGASIDDRPRLPTDNRPRSSVGNRSLGLSRTVAQAYDHTFLKKNRVFSVLLVGGDCFLIAMQVWGRLGGLGMGMGLGMDVMGGP